MNFAAFPKNGPILIITDGVCDRFRTRRDHAILLPKAATSRFVQPAKSSG
jgi:hypothetical protein